MVQREASRKEDKEEKKIQVKYDSMSSLEQRI
jgi:hypothetical protein